MKKIFLVFMCILVFFALSVSCFATDQMTYGFFVPSGTYLADESIDISMLSLSQNGRLTINLRFVSNGVNHTGFYVGKGSSDSIATLSYLPDTTAVYTSYQGGWTNQALRTIEVVEGFTIDDISEYYFWQQNFTRLEAGYEDGLVNGVVSIFGNIGSWIGTAFVTLETIFVSDGSLTFVGTLSILGLAFGVGLLLFSMLRSFLKFK